MPHVKEAETGLRKRGVVTRSFSFFEESSSCQGWGRIVAQYVHDQWVCLSFLLRRCHPLVPATEGDELEPSLPSGRTPEQTLRAALDALSILPSDQVCPVFRCMKTLVPQVSEWCGRSGGVRAWAQVALSRPISLPAADLLRAALRGGLRHGLESPDLLEQHPADVLA